MIGPILELSYMIWPGLAIGLKLLERASGTWGLPIFIPSLITHLCKHSVKDSKKPVNVWA
jgi:hypothetical protein